MITFPLKECAHSLLEVFFMCLGAVTGSMGMSYPLHGQQPVHSAVTTVDLTVVIPKGLESWNEASEI